MRTSREPKWVTIGCCKARVKDAVETRNTWIIKAAGIAETLIIRKNNKSKAKVWSREPRYW